MIALSAFRVVAYVRSHRVYQALLLLLVLLSMVYANRSPAGQELPALTDAAVLIIPVLAWSARSLLDTEPDEQRIVSATLVGGPGREVGAGLLAATAANAAFTALAFAAGLVLGVAQASATVIATAAALHVLALLAGTALGALTSRAILPSPAVSIMMLLLGFLAMLLISASPVYWLTVPVTTWMKAASGGSLAAQLPWLGGIALAWALAGLGGYTWLRRSRP